jgi:hypothetical protein
MPETALVFIHLIVLYSDEELTTEFVQLIGSGLTDASARVRNAALAVSVRLVTPGVVRALTDAVFNLLSDHRLNIVLSVHVLSRFSRVAGFERAPLFEALFSLFDSPDFLIVQSAFQGLFKALKPIEDIGEVMPLLEPTIALLDQSFENPRIDEFQDEVFNLMTCLLGKVTITATQHLEHIWGAYARAN